MGTETVGSITRCSVLTYASRAVPVMDRRRMLLLSMVYRMVRLLLGLTAVLVRRDLDKDAELLTVP